MRRIRRAAIGKIVVSGFILAGIFGTWGVCLHLEYKKVQPSSAVVCFSQFESEMNLPSRIGFFNHGGKEYLNWTGPRMRWFVLPSGSPSYVFNEDGRLLDWTYDDGDDPAYRSRWGGFQDWKATTNNDAKKRWPRLSEHE